MMIFWEEGWVAWMDTRTGKPVKLRGRRNRMTGSIHVYMETVDRTLASFVRIRRDPSLGMDHIEFLPL